MLYLTAMGEGAGGTRGKRWTIVHALTTGEEEEEEEEEEERKRKRTALDEGLNVRRWRNRRDILGRRRWHLLRSNGGASVTVELGGEKELSNLMCGGNGRASCRRRRCRRRVNVTRTAQAACCRTSKQEPLSCCFPPPKNLMMP